MRNQFVINRSLILVCFALFYFFASQALAASLIRGKVVDSKTGNSLPGANVYLEGTHIGAATDMKGNYVINNVPPGAYSMHVTYIGYREKTLQVKLTANEKVTHNIELEKS
ncbi:MAG: carboxypeptidase-like regulatory domain-containing protein [candidate division KSB1 bacterium]|nr:carboxypeptidase-like regulatory domain-containing protein [candidate division KSB1 bacterium]